MKYPGFSKTTLQEVMNSMNNSKGDAFIMSHQHEDNCKTIKSQRMEDCTCGDNLDVVYYRQNGRD